MRTNIPDVFGAGDVTSFPLKIRGDQRVNIGHWQMSQAQGKTDSERHSSVICLLAEFCLYVHHSFFWTFFSGMGKSKWMPWYYSVVIDSSSFFFNLITGRVAALNMLKKPTTLESVPFFWTVLLGKSIRYTGRAFTDYVSALHQDITASLHVIFSCRLLVLGYGEGYTEIIFKGKVEERKFLAFYIK